MKQRICHITTVHPAKDTRIFHKECVSLAAAGFEVYLIVINGKSELANGVNIVGVPCTFNTKLARFVKAPKVAMEKALELDTDLYHFHDPEFLPSARKLIRMGKRVIYDSHEDVPRQILGKAYIPGLVRPLVSSMFERYEDGVMRELSGVIATTEKWKQRFLKSNANTVTVMNYPRLDQLPSPTPYLEKQNEVFYVGDLTRVRGTVDMVAAMQFVDATFNLGGPFSEPGLHDEVAALNSWHKVNELGFIDRSVVHEMLDRSKVGLVVLHPTPAYKEALAVKVFEYMAAGIPVVCSDVGIQSEVVKAEKCGICVPPKDPKAIGDAINYLLANSEEAEAMGQRGRKAVVREYNWETEIKSLLALYDKVLNS